MAAGAVEVIGLQDLITTFRVMPAEITEEFTWELEEAASPVKEAAQQKAPTSLRNMVYTKEWAAMRVGVSRSDITVWVAPFLRGRKRISDRAREAFVKGMQEKALDPALEENSEKVAEKVDHMLDLIAERHGF